MKTSKLVLILASIGLGSMLFVGCSSSGGGTSGGVSGGVAANVDITPAAAETLAQSAAVALPGCSYTSETTLGSPPQYQTIGMLVTEVVKNSREYVASRSTTYDNTYNGWCPTNPGTVRIYGSHLNGVDDLTYVFNGYCVGGATENITRSGTSYMQKVATTTATGPIRQYTTAYTDANGITVTERNADGNFTYLVKSSNVKYSYGNGNSYATVGMPDVVTVGSFSAVDNQTNKSYSVSNVNLSTYIAGTDSVVTINGMTYTDAENGSVTITSTPITMSGTTTDGNITVTGTNGTAITMSPYASVNNGFGLVVDGETVGVMDCSGLDYSTIMNW